MSSWERSRFIPWDRIPLPDTRPRGPGEPPPIDLDTAKERIFRQLQSEAVTKQSEKDDDAKHEQPHNGPTNAIESKGGYLSNIFTSNVSYSNMELLKMAAFGGTIGTITGGVFGFMDGMRTASESPVLKNASNMAKGRYLLQGTTRSASIFGIFFGSFHILKYGLRVTVDPGEFTEIFMVAPVALGALYSQPTLRQAVPYASMLAIMDGINIYMRKTE